MQQGVIYVTERGHQALLERQQQIKANLKGVLGERASAFEDGGGTWHDNAAFDEVNRKEQMVAGQLAQVEDELARAKVVPDRPQNTDRVRVGHVIILECEDEGHRFTYVVAGFGESDPKASPPRVDYTAPLVKPFFGEEAGHEAEVPVGGRKRLCTLVAIEVPASELAKDGAE